MATRVEFDRQVKRHPLTRGDGRWSFDEGRGKVVLRHIVEGTRYTERSETCVQCIADRERRRSRLAVTAGLVDAGRGTVDELLLAWLEFESLGSPTQTVRTYQWSTKHLRRELGHLLPLDLDLTTIEKMYVRLIAGNPDARRRPLSKRSMGKLQSNLGMALAFGERRKYLPEDRAATLRRAVMPGGAAEPRDARWLQIEDYREARRYLIADRTPVHALFMTMMLCGLRPAEAMGLQWRYVDLNRATLRVEGQIRRLTSVHLGEYTHVLKTDRSGRQAHREIALPADLRMVFAELERTGPDGEYVFSEDGTFLSFRDVERAARRIAAEANIQEITPNGYRHTFASVMLHNGKPIPELVRLMGHKDAKQILATYGHSMQRSTSDDMDRYLDSPEW